MKTATLDWIGSDTTQSKLRGYVQQIEDVVRITPKDARIEDSRRITKEDVGDLAKDFLVDVVMINGDNTPEAVVAEIEDEGIDRIIAFFMEWLERQDYNAGRIDR